jgi:hypothetical protein
MEELEHSLNIQDLPETIANMHEQDLYANTNI